MLVLVLAWEGLVHNMHRAAEVSEESRFPRMLVGQGGPLQANDCHIGIHCVLHVGTIIINSCVECYRDDLPGGLWWHRAHR